MVTKRITRLVVIVSTVCCLAFCGLQLARATTVIKLTDQQLVARSQIILEGTVTQMRCEWNTDGTQIHTFIDIATDNVVKGSYQGQTIKLRVLGGIVGNIGMAVIGSPSYSVGEEVLLFLRPNTQSLFPIVGFNQGKFTLTVDATTGQKMIKERKVSRDQFLTHIKGIITEQKKAAVDRKITEKKEVTDENK